MPAPAVRAVSLGLRPYEEALRVQQRCVAAARAARGPPPRPPFECVVLSEPARPVYAWGLRGAPTDKEAERLRAAGAGLAAVRRGGSVTFHGPGQLLAFPVLDLKARGIQLRGFVERLQDVAVRLCRRVGAMSAAGRPPPYTGVWVGESKVCAVGERFGRGSGGDLGRWGGCKGCVCNVGGALRVHAL
ncbi:putative lipoyltransferase 2, mitochondrial [Phasianus colchicus]|uniref:BPL/LPL catalytic domain-containing protein n=1 Tax=Phasianus colchicus TaxID=9054 RepID=A0A669QQ99_PHACC|nr:putative lipoyltransferase 2, mitochondrial [Phasianus colchicus]